MIFPDSKDEPIRRASWRSVWLLTRDEAGLPPFRFHDLRHTGNTPRCGAGRQHQARNHRRAFGDHAGDVILLRSG